jgi:hypothetical protein
MTETEKAYIAGIVDGEGSIHVGFVKRKQCKMPDCITFVQIANTDEPVMRWLKAIIGYGIITKVPARKRGYRTIYHWVARYQQAVRILTDIMPYLRIKRRQAELLCELEQIRHGQPKRCKNREQSLDVLSQYNVIAEAIRILNKSRMLTNKQLKLI